MIFIDAHDVSLLISDEWKAKALAATKELLDAADASERATIIARRSDLWRELKDALAQASHGKCWYCETRDIRSDNAVDHFRPKSSVAEDDSHPGYWWLAFDYSNYRFCCTFCNSSRRDPTTGFVGGKQDSFPLVAGSVRSYSPDELLELEVPMLLDPCCMPDVLLVWFDETGQLRLNPHTSQLDDFAEERLEASRSAYHLDHYLLIDERRKVYREVLSLCDKADKAYTLMKNGIGAARLQYRQIAEDLMTRLKQSAEYSAVARCAILGYRETNLTASMLAHRLS